MLGHTMSSELRDLFRIHNGTGEVFLTPFRIGNGDHVILALEESREVCLNGLMNSFANSTREPIAWMVRRSIDENANSIFLFAGVLIQAENSLTIVGLPNSPVRSRRGSMQQNGIDRLMSTWTLTL